MFFHLTSDLFSLLSTPQVTKLRNQLKLGNSQLNELERLNCELRDRVLTAEAQGQHIAKELEEQCRRHEQDLLTLNLQVGLQSNPKLMSMALEVYFVHTLSV